MLCDISHLPILLHSHSIDPRLCLRQYSAAHIRVSMWTSGLSAYIYVMLSLSKLIKALCGSLSSSIQSILSVTEYELKYISVDVVFILITIQIHVRPQQCNATTKAF